ncbi:MAG: hypothetical protein ABIH57_02640 [Candidatus Omnitrophota bacterium]
MKKIFFIMTALGLVFSLALIGCGAKKANSSSDAIKVSRMLKTTQEKANYLVGQAKAFYGSKKFQDAVDTAQYVLRYLDKDSGQAKNLIDQAKKELASQAKSKLDAIQKNFSSVSEAVPESK